MTHWIPPFTRRRPDGTQEAFCGRWIEEAEYSTEPSCPDCRAKMEQDTVDLAGLLDEPIDVGPPVTHVDFNPTAGYRPRKYAR